MTTDLAFDDLVETCICANEPGGGPVHDYWAARFDLMCLEFGIVTSNFSRDEQSLWWFGELVARDCSHRFGSGIYEMPRVVADFSRLWSRELTIAESDRARVLREMLAALLLKIAPDAIHSATTLERLIELGLPKDVPDPFDYF